jgi:hypothetical protein
MPSLPIEHFADTSGSIVVVSADDTSVVQKIHQRVHGVAVKVVAVPIVPSGHTRVGVPSRDLYVTQWNTCIKTGSYEGVAERMRADVLDDAGLFAQALHCIGGRIAVHRPAICYEQQLSRRPARGCFFQEGQYRGGQRDGRRLLPFTEDAQF